MAETSRGEGQGLPLEAFNHGTPPGWKPYLHSYPFRRWLGRLKLWYRHTDVDASQAASAVAARLAGAPINLVMALQITLPTGEHLSGDAALARPSTRGVVDAAGNPVADTPNGLSALLTVLSGRCGNDAQFTSIAVADAFLDLRRGRLGLME